MNTNKLKKLSTGITGLDALLYGGIHIHNGDNEKKGIVVLARGQHGVNKIHLAMQMCEGLFRSSTIHPDKTLNNIENNYNDALLFYFYNRERENIINKATKNIEQEIKKFKENKYKSSDIERIEDNNNAIKVLEEKKERWKKAILDMGLGFALTRNAIDANKIKVILDDKKEQDGLLVKIIKWFISANEADWEKKIRESIYLNDTSDSDASPQILFLSINKDNGLLRNSYYDFYIQRLIRNIRANRNDDEVKKSLYTLRTLFWYKDEFCNKKVQIGENTFPEIYELPSITGKEPRLAGGFDLFRDHLTSGFIYYNSRTHGLHVRHQKGAVDTGDMLLCKLHIPDDHLVRIVGKDVLNQGNSTASGLETFQNMMRELDIYDSNNNDSNSDKGNQNDAKDVDRFIMVDGLSRLNKEELSQCPLNALSDKLRSMCTVGIITADEKLLPTDISTDIVLDMEIRSSERADYLYNAIKISKCLYQKNAYGWHHYKMRNAGIDIIPSVHHQIVQRFLMEDAVTDASRPINKFPYPYWLNENDTVYDDENICSAEKAYLMDSIVSPSGSLLGIIQPYDYQMAKIVSQEVIVHGKHVLFLNFDKNRSDFYRRYLSIVSGSGITQNRVHLFNFQPGYIHADEFLWVLDQQVQAIEKKARNGRNEELTTHYMNISLIIGDYNYIHYAYPCLSAEPLLLPALAIYTKRHHMTNYIYATLNNDNNTIDTDLFKKEMETIMQIRRICTDFENQ